MCSPGTLDLYRNALPPGHYVRPAADWVIPPFKAVDARRAWTVGVDTLGPFKDLSAMVPASQKAAWKKFKSLMKIIEGHIANVDLHWAVIVTSDTEARAAYAEVAEVVEVEGSSHKRRHEQLKWTTVLKNYEARRAQQNKRARQQQQTHLDEN